MVNPPSAHKYQYWTGDCRAPALADFVAGATEHPGSWWTEWGDWLNAHSGKQVAAPKSYGNRTYKPIEAAPGRYVKQKA